MFHLPDLTFLFYFAAIGFLCAVGVGLWLAYHVLMALALYVGVM